MPYYEWRCPDCQETVLVKRGLRESSQPVECPQCGSDCQRVYYPPMVMIVPDAVDVLNQAADGEGDTLPGWTREKTKRTARSLAKSIREGH